VPYRRKKLTFAISSPDEFLYAYVKGKAKVGRNIGPLIGDKNEVVDSAEGMSQEFNKFFSLVFTKEPSGEVPEADCVYKDNDDGLSDIEITEKIVSEKLDRLRDDKAAGVQDQIICSLDF